MSNLFLHLDEALRHRGASELFDTGVQRVAARELLDASARYGNALRRLGVEAGDRVAAQVDKSLENVALYLACLRIGAIYLPLNTAYRAAEVEYFLSDATPRVFVCEPQREAELSGVAEKSGARSVTLGIHADGSLAMLAAREATDAPIVECGDDDVAVICYTSGTTGRSKGAMITHGNLISNARALIELWQFTTADTLLHALPLYHIHGLFVGLHVALLSGAKILFQHAFNARAIVDLLPRATVLMGVPTFYTRLLAEATFTKESTRSMRVFISGSAPLLADTFEAFERRTGHRILERYGMTEAQMIASNPLGGERRPQTVGRPLPHVDVRIVREDGQPAEPGEIGVVHVRGPNVFKGYWRMPEKTAAEFRDGYFITGDLGTLSADGYLQLVGRAKDLIISGGLNVYPKEIEEAIDALDGVTESAVFGIPHPDFGEAVAAAVTLRSEATLTGEAIIADLRQRLAAFKTPKRVFIVADLPRNAMSKVQKNVLRERYRSEFAN